MTDWSKIKFFTAAEFDSPDAPGSGASMDSDFILLLDELRQECGFPFHISSGFRTPSHNSEVGGVGESAHTLGKAADIVVRSGSQRFRLVEAALAHGVKRIGIGSTFVHLDLDHSKPEPAIWTYPSKT